MKRAVLLLVLAQCMACFDFEPSHYRFACDEGRCVMPPENQCLDASTLRAYVSPGICELGGCTYSRVDITCAQGCANGRCVGELCSGVSCTTPPAALCVGSTLRQFSNSGACEESTGACGYSSSDTECPLGCSAGACLTESGTGGGSGGTGGGAGATNLSALVLDQTVFAVDGVVQVNGLMPTRDATWCTANPDDVLAVITFADASKKHYTSTQILCSTATFGFSTQLPPGTYEVTIQADYSAPSTASNLFSIQTVVLPALTVSGPISNLILNEVGYPVSGKVLVNGVTPTRSASGMTWCSSRADYEIGWVNFIDSAGRKGWVGIKCSTTDFSFSTMLPPGTYDVQIEADDDFTTNAGVNLMPLEFTALSGLAVSGPVTNLTLNENGYPVSGQVTVNGQTPTKDSAFCQTATQRLGSITFRDRAKGYLVDVDLLCSSGFSFSTLLPEGSWEVRVRQDWLTRRSVDLSCLGEGTAKPSRDLCRGNAPTEPADGGTQQ